MPRFLCLPCQTPRGDAHEYIHCAALVEADGHDTAAALGRELMEVESNEDPDADYFSNMFVIEINSDEWVAMNARPFYERCPDEWQCCGGPCEFIEDGHYASCPNHGPSKREKNIE